MGIAIAADDAVVFLAYNERKFASDLKVDEFAPHIIGRKLGIGKNYSARAHIMIENIGHLRGIGEGSGS